MTTRPTAKDLRHMLAWVVGLVCVLALLATPAQGLTTDRTTAAPNQDGGRNVIGGEPTRITWVGTVEEGEEVTGITLLFPAGCELSDDSYVKVQEMDMSDPQHPLHNERSATIDLTAARLIVELDEPIPAGNLLYVEIYKFCLPPVSGQVIITGTYTDASGASHDLTPSPPIDTIALTSTQRLINDLSEQEWVKAWNSVKFLNIFVNPLWIVASIPSLFFGWLRSLGLVLLGFPLAIPVGLGISFLRMSRFRLLRFVSSIYVNIIRGTPLFLQIYIAFFGLPLLGIKPNDYLLGVLVLAMNSSAYLAEIFRAGIQSIHKGQFEAASSLGMNGVQTMFFVIIPQTVRRVIPTMTSEFILLFKDTSLLAAVGVMEQMMFAKTLVNTAGNMTPYVIAACYYLIVTLPLTRIISVFEKRLAASEGREAPPGDKDKMTKRVGLFKTIAPLSATDSEPLDATTPERHSSA
ncbi:MAG: amino acid ABC transporter permease [Coriobacteriales bacterium]|jgi:polar amino acid transport system substrate-binding protein|nr:amino acid ABC transporter permease [Coriobacteriales bacterium]